MNGVCPCDECDECGEFTIDCTCPKETEEKEEDSDE